MDVAGTLSNSIDPQAYWRKLKERLLKEGSETVTKCHALKMVAIDGKMRLTDVADTEVILRLIQSIPSPNAEPFKLRLARVEKLFPRIAELPAKEGKSPGTPDTTLNLKPAKVPFLPKTLKFYKIMEYAN